VPRLLADRTASPADLIKAAAPWQPRDGDEAAEFLAAVTWNATGDYRSALLRAVAPLGLEVFGDSAWARTVPGVRLHPPVDYEGVPAIYAASDINLNATSLQMPTAVNQRVFDVPVAGGFVLSDAQADLHELFAADEVATYGSPEELHDRAAWFLAHPEQRRAIAERGRARVLREHTYAPRLERVLATLRRLVT
jgi:spore maturation protein CgeB